MIVDNVVPVPIFARADHHVALCHALGVVEQDQRLLSLLEHQPHHHYLVAPHGTAFQCATRQQTVEKPRLPMAARHKIDQILNLALRNEHQIASAVADKLGQQLGHTRHTLQIRSKKVKVLEQLSLNLGVVLAEMHQKVKGIRVDAGLLFHSNVVKRVLAQIEHGRVRAQVEQNPLVFGAMIFVHAQLDPLPQHVQNRGDIVVVDFSSAQNPKLLHQLLHLLVSLQHTKKGHVICKQRPQNFRRIPARFRLRPALALA